MQRELHGLPTRSVVQRRNHVPAPEQAGRVRQDARRRLRDAQRRLRIRVALRT